MATARAPQLQAADLFAYSLYRLGGPRKPEARHVLADLLATSVLGASGSKIVTNLQVRDYP